MIPVLADFLFYCTDLLHLHQEKTYCLYHFYYLFAFLKLFYLSLSSSLDTPVVPFQFWELLDIQAKYFPELHAS